MKRGLIALGTMLALAACGKPAGGGGGLLAGGWNEIDACKTLDKAAVAAAAGQPVKSTELSNSSPAAEGRAATTMCNYTLANDAIVGFMTRVSHDSDLSDAEIAEMRTAGGTMPDVEDVPGLGMKAFWTRNVRMLQVVPDRKRWLSIVYQPPFTLPGTPAKPGPDPKTLALTLAKKVI